MEGFIRGFSLFSFFFSPISLHTHFWCKWSVQYYTLFMPIAFSRKQQQSRCAVLIFSYSQGQQSLEKQKLLLDTVGVKV